MLVYSCDNVLRKWTSGVGPGSNDTSVDFGRSGCRSWISFVGLWRHPCEPQGGGGFCVNGDSAVRCYTQPGVADSGGRSVWIAHMARCMECPQSRSSQRDLVNSTETPSRKPRNQPTRPHSFCHFGARTAGAAPSAPGTEAESYSNSTIWTA